MLTEFEVVTPITILSIVLYSFGLLLFLRYGHLKKLSICFFFFSLSTASLTLAYFGTGSEEWIKAFGIEKSGTFTGFWIELLRGLLYIVVATQVIHNYFSRESGILFMNIR
ncbi:MAG: hypothetical protein SFY68_09585, partial [Candidatus Sumerlaeia bacterium]|nr:hypothetical protein [Candidatus Sumerlaeia bacterium]